MVNRAGTASSTIQKQIKFSKGQVSEALSERTDIGILDASALAMCNYVPNIQGGFRTRRGTKLLDVISFGLNPVTGVQTAPLSERPEALSDKTDTFVSNLAENTDIFCIDYQEIKASGIFSVRGICLNYEPAVVETTTWYDGDWFHLKEASLISGGVGMTQEAVIRNDGEAQSGGGASFEYELDEKGSMVSVSVKNAGNWGDKQGARPTKTNTIIRGSNGWQANVVFSISTDGVVFQDVLTTLVAEQAANFDISINESFRYVRMRLAEEEVPKTTLSIQYVELASGVEKVNQAVRLERFLFNNQEKYMCVFSAGRVSVYEEGLLKYVLAAPSLLEDYIKQLRVSQKEDTMIVCHESMEPYQIRRTVENNQVVFKWEAFQLKNIPYHAFDGEITTAKSVPITPSATEGAVTITAQSDVFTEECVGQFIDGGGGRMRITQFVDTKKVSGYTIIPFYTTDQISTWNYITGYSPVWSETRGWPKTCLFAGQRLWFGGSKSRPCTVWASRINQYNDFQNAGNYDNDAIDVDLLTNNPIVGMVYNRGLQIFTYGEEWVANENNLTPTGFSVAVNTRNGSYPNITPVTSGGVVCFIEKNGKSLLSFVYDYNQANYRADDLSLLSDLMDKPLRMDLEVNSAVDKGDFLFIVLENGKMLVNTICFAENVNAVSVFETNGKVVDVCCLVDQTYVLVNRNERIFLEMLGEEKTDATRKITVDGCVANGLEPYNDMKVVVYDGDRIVAENYVNEGVLALGKNVVGTYDIGIDFQCLLMSNYIEVGNQTTSIQKRIARMCIETQKTPCLCVNGICKKAKGETFHFYGCSGYRRKVQFKIESQHYWVHVKSITIYVNFGGYQ